jgi:hypothetical protein
MATGSDWCAQRRGYMCMTIAEPKSNSLSTGSRIEICMTARALARALQARLGLTSLYPLRAEPARAYPSARLEPARVHHYSILITGA